MKLYTIFSHNANTKITVHIFLLNIPFYNNTPKTKLNCWLALRTYIGLDSCRGAPPPAYSHVVSVQQQGLERAFVYYSNHHI